MSRMNFEQAYSGKNNLGGKLTPVGITLNLILDHLLTASFS